MAKHRRIDTPEDRTDARPLRIGRPRAALVVYRLINEQPHVLLIASANNPDKLTLPGGKIGPDESPIQAAMRETAEEAGVLTDRPELLGQYLHRKRKRRYHPTDTYLARFVGTLHEYEGRRRVWVHLDELAVLKPSVRKMIRKQLKQAFTQLHRQHVAA